MVAAAAAGLAFWPSHKARAAYPFLRRVGGGREPLWEAEPERLSVVTEEDASRLERFIPLLDNAVKALETLEPRLANGRVGELTPDDRELLRRRWFDVLDPLLAIDEIKSRYHAWYGLDYVQQPLLHARAFALSFSALCAQADAGLRLLDAIQGKPLLPILFDEAMPSVGLPARTFSGLRSSLVRAQNLFFVPFGGQWYDQWIRPKLAGDGKLAGLLAGLDALRARTQARVLEPSTRAFENQTEVVKSELFVRWFPIQRDVAEWAGDTRFTKEERHLIDDAQLAIFRGKLRPGDVIVERRNWYVSNAGLPGFWPHAALYVGTQQEIFESLATVPEVVRVYGDLATHFAKVAPKAWAAFAGRDASGHDCRVMEAVSEGVVASSIEHSCAADYVAALRPRLPALNRVRAIERALLFYGRPYDFNFDFGTDDQLVCSELVIKAYEPEKTDDQGLRVPYVELVGRRAVPPTSLVQTFRDERGQKEPQFEFVYFLEGREHEKRAVVADADALAATVTRPKWDIVQP